MNLSNIFSVVCVINFFLIEYVFNISEKISSQGIIWFGCFFLTLPLALLFSSSLKMKKSMEGKNWPSVRGRVSSVDASDSILDGLLGQKFSMIYDYYVSDRLHSNDQYNSSKSIVRIKDLFDNKQLRNKNISNISGTMVKVYFNPENPWDSMLSNRVNFDAKVLLLPSLNALIIVLYLFYCIY